MTLPIRRQWRSSEVQSRRVRSCWDDQNLGSFVSFQEFMFQSLIMWFIKELSCCRGKRSFWLQKGSTGVVRLGMLRGKRLHVAQMKVPQVLSYAGRGEHQYRRQDLGLEKGCF